jgi:hypothetical protein
MARQALAEQKLSSRFAGKNPHKSAASHGGKQFYLLLHMIL